MNKRTNERTYEWKDENYISLGINAGGINRGSFMSAHILLNLLTEALLSNLLIPPNKFL